MKIKGAFCERTLAPAAFFDRRSFRWKKSGRAWLLVGCPRGYGSRKGCKVGMRGHKILVPAHGRCRMGKLIRKGAR